VAPKANTHRIGIGPVAPRAETASVAELRAPS
jgi:hypothetical protein